MPLPQSAGESPAGARSQRSPGDPSYLRIVSDVTRSFGRWEPALSPSPSSTRRSQGRRSKGPRLQLVTLPSPNEPLHPSARRSPRALKLASALAVILFVAAQVYVHRETARWERDSAGERPPAALDGNVRPEGTAWAGLPGKSESLLRVSAPVGPVTADLLTLNWEAVPEAWHYLLRIRTIAGALLVDQLVVEETSWAVPVELLSALVPGDYTWQVEAVDRAGQALARSAPAALQITR